MNNKTIDTENNKHKRNKSLLLLGITAAITGIINSFTENNGLVISFIRLLLPLIAIAIVYFWIIYDAKMHQYSIPKYIKYIIILFGVIGIPIYFWKTRNFKDFCLNFAGLWLFIYYYFVFYIFAVITAFALASLGYY